MHPVLEQPADVFLHLCCIKSTTRFSVITAVTLTEEFCSKFNGLGPARRNLAFGTMVAAWLMPSPERDRTELPWHPPGKKCSGQEAMNGSKQRVV